MMVAAMSNQEFPHIRALRAAPPLLAEDTDRRAVFGAALEQSQELFAAAAVVGPAAKPLNRARGAAPRLLRHDGRPSAVSSLEPD